MTTHFINPASGRFFLTATLGLVVSLSSVTARAATIEVSSTADSGPGSLREAIATASAGDTITFSVLGTITLTNGELVVAKDLLITGPGPGHLTIQGGGLTRLFGVFPGMNVSLSGLTLANGLAESGAGGAILNAGSLRLSQCAVTNCQARAGFPIDAGGGAILNETNAVLTVVDCVFVANRAVGGDVFGSTESDGGDGLGGAIFNQGGDLVVTNCTFTGNRAQGGSFDGAETFLRLGSGLGGAVFNEGGNATLMNCTIVSNTAAGGVGGAPPGEAHGGGLYRRSGEVRVKNTLVAGNSAEPSHQAATPLDLAGDFISLGHNLVGSGDEAFGLTNAINGDLVGTVNSPIDPIVGALADNGGPTFTHALLPGSPAINAGDNAGIPATDQRGFPRLSAATVDIGAYEAPAPNSAPVANPQTAEGVEDADLVITLSGTDVENDPLKAFLVSLPGVGTLYQYDQGLRGGAITAVPAVVLDSAWRLVYSPPTNASGSPFTAFDFLVNDGLADSALATVTINVLPVNDPPGFSKGADQVVGEDAGPQSVADWATQITPGPSDEAAQHLTFILTNDNAALFVDPPAVTTNGTLTYTPAADAAGSALVSVWLQDDGGTANGGLDTSPVQTFLIMINPVNDPPSFVQGPDQAVNEDSGAHSVSGWANVVRPGPPDEAVQTLDFQVSNDNHSLFSTPPAIAPDGTLTFATAADAYGVAAVTVVLQDNGGTVNEGQDTSPPVTFAIAVRPVNDAPSFTKGPGQHVNRNAGVQSVPGWATGLGIGPPNEVGQTLDFLVSNNNSALFAVPPAIASTGTLTYTPASNAGGSATVTVRAHDNGGTLNGGVDTSVPQEFQITVNAPPLVRIIDPTNATVFIAPATFPVVAEATDSDGSVTNMQVFAQTNLLGEVPTNLCFAVWSNVMTGVYELSALATDDLGLSATSTVVIVNVVDAPPVGPLGRLVLNRQTGLFEQTVRVSNPTPLPIAAVRLLITNPLPPGVVLWNASGTNSGQPFVQHDPPVPPYGGWVDFRLEYYLTNRPGVTNLTDAAGVFNPGYLARLVPPATPPEPAITNAVSVQPIVLTNGNFLVEFSTEASRFYYVQYSGDLTNWRTAVPVVVGNGSRVQWIDAGPPKTESRPASVPSRFYRVIVLP